MEGIAHVKESVRAKGWGYKGDVQGALKGWEIRRYEKDIYNINFALFSVQIKYTLMSGYKL